MAKQHGYKGEIGIDATPGSPMSYTAVASAKSWSLDASRDRVDATTFGNTNKEWLQGLPNYSGNIGFIWDPTTTPTQIFDVVLGDTAVGLKLIPSTLTSTAYFSGLAYLDGGITVDVGGAIEGTGSWVAAGPWSVAP